jgi:HlyD family secretion protein
MSWKPKNWSRQRQQQAAARSGPGKADAGKAGADKSDPGNSGGARSGSAAGRGYGTTIFVLGPDGEPQPRRIRLGAADNDNSIVLGGDLKPGEQVITAEIDPKAKEGSSRGGGGGRPSGG